MIPLGRNVAYNYAYTKKNETTARLHAAIREAEKSLKPGERVDEIWLHQTNRVISAMLGQWRLRGFPMTWGCRFQRVKVPTSKDTPETHFLALWAEHRYDGSLEGFVGIEDPVLVMESYKPNAVWTPGSDAPAFVARRGGRINMRFRTPHTEKDDGEAFYLFALLEKYMRELYANRRETGDLRHPTVTISSLKDFAFGYESYKEACFQEHLLHGDGGHAYLSHLQAIEETGRRFRWGFALLLKDRQILDPLETAATYWHELTDDLRQVDDENDIKGVMIHRGFSTRAHAEEMRAKKRQKLATGKAKAAPARSRRDQRPEARRPATADEIRVKLWESLENMLAGMGGSLRDALGAEPYASLNLGGRAADGDPASRYPRDKAIRDYLEALPTLNEQQLKAWWGMHAQLLTIREEIAGGTALAADFAASDPARLGPEGMAAFFQWAREFRATRQQRNAMKGFPSSSYPLAWKRNVKEAVAKEKLTGWFDDPDIMEELAKRLQQSAMDRPTTLGSVARSEMKRTYGTGRAHLVEARGGAGKTRFINVLEAYCRAYFVPFVSMAFSGYASTSLMCGTTCHSRFRVDIKDGTVRLPPFSKPGANPLVDQLRRARVFIVDEVFSLRANVVANMARFIHGQQDNSGEGKITLGPDGQLDLFGARNLSVLGGDRSQVLPIVPYNCTRAQFQATLLATSWAEHLTEWTFEKNMRVSDAKWAEELANIAEGRVEVDADNTMAIPSSIPAENIFHHDLADVQGDPQMKAADRENISMKLYPPLVKRPEGGRDDYLRLDPDKEGRDDREFVRDVVRRHAPNMYIACHNREVRFSEVSGAVRLVLSRSAI